MKAHQNLQPHTTKDECSLRFLKKPGLAEVCWQLKDQHSQRMKRYHYQRVNLIKSNETTIFPWFSYGFPMVYVRACRKGFLAREDMESVRSSCRRASGISDDS